MAGTEKAHEPGSHGKNGSKQEENHGRNKKTKRLNNNETNEMQRREDEWQK